MIQLESSWLSYLQEEFEKPYMQDLRSFLLEEKKSYTLFPKSEFIFRAFDLCPFHQVKVVILGQDPYHGRGQAHGLAFSVGEKVSIPPSLRNIFLELESDLSIPPSLSGNLEYWASQGVLLLNSVLTVREGLAGSHQGKGWEIFTDKAIACLSAYKRNIVFILWGSYAQSKENLIDTDKHCIIKSPHPSPLSSYRGFFGSKPFSKANNYLRRNNIPEVDWNLRNPIAVTC